MTVSIHGHLLNRNSGVFPKSPINEKGFANKYELALSLGFDHATSEEMSKLDDDQWRKIESVTILEFFRANALELKHITDADERQLAGLESAAIQELIANKEITPVQVLDLLDHAPFELLAIRDLIADRVISVERANMLNLWTAQKIARLSSRKLVNLMLAENSGIAHIHSDPTDFLDDHFCAMQSEAARIFDYEGPSLRSCKEAGASKQTELKFHRNDKSAVF